MKFHIRVFATWEKFLWKAAVWENVFGNVPNIFEMKSLVEISSLLFRVRTDRVEWKDCVVCSSV